MEAFEYDKVRSASGRKLSPAPVALGNARVLNVWLIYELYEEALARGDHQFLRDAVGDLDGNLTERERKALNWYLFGDDRGIRILWQGGSVRTGIGEGEPVGADSGRACALPFTTFDCDNVVSVSGRKLSRFPVSADMKLEERLAASRKWLVREAVEEGRERGDIQVVSDILTCETGVFDGGLTERQVRMLNLYLFGNEEGINVTVIKVRGGKRVV